MKFFFIFSLFLLKCDSFLFYSNKKYNIINARKKNIDKDIYDDYYDTSKESKKVF